MTKPVLFISDLHLDAKRPEIVALFLRFLAEQREQARGLYILGDLFEAWIGDDLVRDDDPVVGALRAFAERVPTFFMHGNRDFLVGERFADLTGIRLLPDPSVIELAGEITLLMHGDSLCTDDRDYQRFRQTVRDPAWQAVFLAKPAAERIELARQARSASGERNRQLADYLMDVNQQTVESEMRRHAVRRLIHGHTHRPAVHRFALDGREHIRVVLGDWHDQGSVLRVTEDEMELRGLPLA